LVRGLDASSARVLQSLGDEDALDVLNLDVENLLKALASVKL
jgi:hypothetical protein